MENMTRQFLKSIQFILAVVIFGSCNNALAQTAIVDIRQEIDELKQGQEAMREDLQEIKSLLEKIAMQPTGPTPSGPVIKDVEFEIGDNPIKGNSAVGVILVEFTDYQCPFCGRFVRETFSLIRERYIDKGAIRYAVVDLPLAMHPDAERAAQASHCAEEQGKFWEIHEQMMSRQDSLTDLSSFAASLNLDVQKFDDCVSTGKYVDAVRKDMALTQKLGINGVPGFIIGRVESNNPMKIKGIAMIQGAMPFARFQQELDAVLATP